MSKYFEIDGYWLYSKEPFSGYVVKEFDDVIEDDDIVFFFGMSENDLQQAIKLKEDTTLDFVVTSYQEIKLI
jgi:hypothetical protein